MTTRGFTLVELLMALVVSLGVAGGALLLAGAARTAIVVEPASTDTARRLQHGVDTIAAAIAGAGGERGVGAGTATLWSGVPALRLVADPGGTAFTGLLATRAVAGGRGRLVADQPGPGGSLALAAGAGLCPASQVVCGFRDGDVAVVFDDRGHFDIFTVGAVSPALNRITPRVPLADAYRAGAWVIEVRHERLGLVRQADGSQTLTRTTAAGAREPIVDGVTSLVFTAWGEAAPPELYVTGASRIAGYGLPPPDAIAGDPEGIFPMGSHCMAVRDDDGLRSRLAPTIDVDSGLSPLSPAALDDGPWCPHDDAPDRFDADWFRVRRVDVRLAVEVLSAELRGPAGSWFARGGTGGHDAPRWVRDRSISVSLVVGR